MMRKTKQQLLLAYNAGRGNLLLMTALTAVNVALVLFGAAWSFLFTAFFPYICAVFAKSGYLGMSEAASMILGCALPVVLCFVCWLLSDKQRYVWLKTAAALFALDTVYMLYFFVAYGFDTVFILAILFHALILWQLIRGSVAAKRLANGDYDETPVCDAQATVLEADPASAVDLNAVPTAERTYFRYDRAHANGSGANKTGRIVLTALVFFVWMFGGAGLSVWLLDVRLKLGLEAAIPVIVVVCAAAIAWFIVSLVRLSAFLEAHAAVYYVNEYGVLQRDKTDIPPFNHTVFNALALVEELPDRWVVRYTSKSGKRKKTVIPKAYPGLEGYMSRLTPEAYR